MELVRLTQDKVAIRNALLAKRRGIAPSVADAKGKAIRERLEGLPEYAGAEGLCVYVSSKDNEVDTHDLIQRALDQGRSVSVPIAGARGRLLWSRLRALDELAPNRFGILEPLPEFRRMALPDSRSVVVVPGIGFTPGGGRIGYGGGYFDRFLSGFRGVSIALAYGLQVVESLPQTAHDIPVDLVVTESEVYRRTTADQSP